MGFSVGDKVSWTPPRAARTAWWRTSARVCSSSTSRSSTS